MIKLLSSLSQVVIKLSHPSSPLLSLESNGAFLFVACLAVPPATPNTPHLQSPGWPSCWGPGYSDGYSNLDTRMRCIRRIKCKKCISKRDFTLCHHIITTWPPHPCPSRWYLDCALSCDSEQRNRFHTSCQKVSQELKRYQKVRSLCESIPDIFRTPMSHPVSYMFKSKCHVAS